MNICNCIGYEVVSAGIEVKKGRIERAYDSIKPLQSNMFDLSETRRVVDPYSNLFGNRFTG